MHTHVFLSAFKKAFQEIQGCFATSCAQASFETTVRLGCVLRKDHLQRWQSHQGDTNQGKPAHERLNHWMQKCARTVVVVGTAVSTRPVRWCVSGCSETEQGDALQCQNAEQTCRGQEYSRNRYRHSMWCRESGNLFRCLLRRRWFRER